MSINVDNIMVEWIRTLAGSKRLQGEYGVDLHKVNKSNIAAMKEEIEGLS